MIFSVQAAIDNSAIVELKRAILHSSSSDETKFHSEKKWRLYLLKYLSSQNASLSLKSCMRYRNVIMLECVYLILEVVEGM